MHVHGVHCDTAAQARGAAVSSCFVPSCLVRVRSFSWQAWAELLRPENTAPACSMEANQRHDGKHCLDCKLQTHAVVSTTTQFAVVVDMTASSGAAHNEVVRIVSGQVEAVAQPKLSCSH